MCDHTVGQLEQMLLVPKQGLFATGLLPSNGKVLCSVISVTEQHESSV